MLGRRLELLCHKGSWFWVSFVYQFQHSSKYCPKRIRTSITRTRISCTSHYTIGQFKKSKFRKKCYGSTLSPTRTYWLLSANGWKDSTYITCYSQVVFYILTHCDLNTDSMINSHESSPLDDRSMNMEAVLSWTNVLFHYWTALNRSAISELFTLISSSIR